MGVTANSFNSVSLDPPMVLWSLARSSRSLAAFTHSQHFSVHILAQDQDALSNQFARSGADKFAGLTLECGAGGVPLLTGCAARLQCRTAFQYEGGDHIIFVGEVVAMDRSDAPPLVFQAGRYAVATAKTAVQAFSAEAQDDDASFSENFTGYLLARAHFQFYSQLRTHLQQHALSDTEYFVLSVLLVREGRSIGNFNERFSYTGHQVTMQLIARLEVKGLLRTVGPAGQQLCHLTEQGRAVTLRIIAAAKALEADMLARLGEWDAVALKNLLKQFILHTDPGLAHPWSE
ncbi:flavin reductase [Pseudoduganella sp. UC29_106]|uniref:flavin reductase n=1 Tax=Pseudoduganella sp. UC29_106 TaxID=3374553 RepID=UPI003756DC1D